MCSSKIAFTCLLVTGLVQAVITRYAFDPNSCNNFYGYYVKRAVAEAISMANHAATRIMDPNDQVTARLFETIWKVTRDQEPKPLS
jgi:hypothetical protein